MKSHCHFQLFQRTCLHLLVKEITNRLVLIFIVLGQYAVGNLYSGGFVVNKETDQNFGLIFVSY